MQHSIGSWIAHFSDPRFWYVLDTLLHFFFLQWLCYQIGVKCYHLKYLDDPPSLVPCLFKAHIKAFNGSACIAEKIPRTNCQWIYINWKLRVNKQSRDEMISLHLLFVSALKGEFIQLDVFQNVGFLADILYWFGDRVIKRKKCRSKIVRCLFWQNYQFYDLFSNFRLPLYSCTCKNTLILYHALVYAHYVWFKIWIKWNLSSIYWCYKKMMREKLNAPLIVLD